jgi:hypothetical protein
LLNVFLQIANTLVFHKKKKKNFQQNWLHLDLPPALCNIVTC